MDKGRHSKFGNAVSSWRLAALMLITVALLSPSLAANNTRGRQRKRKRQAAAVSSTCVWQQKRHIASPLTYTMPVSDCSGSDTFQKKSFYHQHFAGLWNTPFFNLTHSKPFFFCWIAKNSCTKFKYLMSRMAEQPFWSDDQMNRNPDKKSSGKAHSWVSKVNAAWWKKATDAEFSSVFSSPDVRRVLVIRDPIDRFLSGYMHVVVKEKRGDALPRGPDKKPMTFNATSEDIKRYLDHTDRWLRYDHMGPQSSWCGIRRYGVRVWDTIAVYAKDNMVNVYKELGDKLDWGAYLDDGWGPNGSQPLFEGFTRHTFSGSPQGSPHDLLTRSICEKLVLIFFEDYANFFPLIQPQNCSQYPEQPKLQSLDV